MSNGSDDDFGSFSDASYESEAKLQTDLNIQETVNECIEALFDGTDTEIKGTGDETHQLEDLLADERPNVIYHELVEDQPYAPPFIWNRSHIRSTVLNILRIPDPLLKRVDNSEEDTEVTDGSLFTQITHLIDDPTIPLSRNIALLKEHLHISYIPPLTPVSLTGEYKEEQQSRIPQYLLQDLSKTDNMKEFHDTLCSVIDQLMVELRDLNIEQAKLIDNKQTFEHVVTNLTGHTQRLQRDEIALFNKKKGHHNKWHRFSWVGK